MPKTKARQYPGSTRSRYSPALLRKWMDARGMASTEVAEESGVSYRTVKRALAGQNVGPANWQRIANSLSIELLELIPVQYHPRKKADAKT